MAIKKTASKIRMPPADDGLSGADGNAFYISISIQTGEIGGRKHIDMPPLMQYFDTPQSYIKAEQLILSKVLGALADAGVDLGDLALAALAELEAGGG